MATTIRLGLGREKTGKILDRETKWYTLGQKSHAIDEWNKNHKKIFVSRNCRAFKEITIDELINL